MRALRAILGGLAFAGPTAAYAILSFVAGG
jgi:hypothetical protein